MKITVQKLSSNCRSAAHLCLKVTRLLIFVLQDRYNELDTQYKESMVSNAKLYDEKTALVFQVESLKDLLEDRWHDVLETKAESQRFQSVSREGVMSRVS